MRDRSWRRHIEESVLKKRLINISNNIGGYWWSFENVNRSRCGTPLLIDYLNRKEHFDSKTITTNKNSSSCKVKFSPNKNKETWRVRDFETREGNKKYLRNILKENGLI
jgi:hypothetical protein